MTIPFSCSDNPLSSPVRACTATIPFTKRDEQELYININLNTARDTRLNVLQNLLQFAPNTLPDLLAFRTTHK
jgi:hypothetical protein